VLLKQLEISKGINIQLLEDDNAQVFIRMDLGNIVMDTNFLPDEPTALKVLADMQKRLAPEQHKINKLKLQFKKDKAENMRLKNLILNNTVKAFDEVMSKQKKEKKNRKEKKRG